jgi:hypothetical protein
MRYGSPPKAIQAISKVITIAMGMGLGAAITILVHEIYYKLFRSFFKAPDGQYSDYGSLFLLLLLAVIGYGVNSVFERAVIAKIPGLNRGKLANDFGCMTLFAGLAWPSFISSFSAVLESLSFN